nr:MAG TPA: hypothetical protein [Caudoviricetes sp.]
MIFSGAVRRASDNSFLARSKIDMGSSRTGSPLSILV